jgi:hypothetical protein
MNQSESIKEISKAMISFHQKINKIGKDAKNPFFKSKYASLSNILDAIQNPLSDSGLSICQFPTGQNGLTSILMHQSGEWISAEYEMKPVKDDPQGRGSCITYQRRYALAAILSLNIDEDDDGNKASYPQRVTNEMKEELIASLIDLEMDDSKRQLAYSSIQNCQEIGEFSKIKTRLQQFKPGPSQLKTDVEKEIKNLTTKLKTNV